MIIGIALVVEELHKGQRLVFRYPEGIPSSVFGVQNTHPLLFQALLKLHRDHQSLSPDNLARLFKKKKNITSTTTSSSSSQVLEVSIDDLKYISHPISCGEGGGVLQLEEHSSMHSSSSSSASDRITQFNVIITTVCEPAVRRILARCNPSEFSGKSVQNPGCYNGNLDLNSLRNIDQSTLHRVIEMFSVALLHEEKKCQYVSEQVKLMTSDDLRSRFDESIPTSAILIEKTRSAADNTTATSASATTTSGSTTSSSSSSSSIILASTSRDRSASTVVNASTAAASLGATGARERSESAAAPITTSAINNTITPQHTEPPLINTSAPSTTLLDASSHHLSSVQQANGAHSQSIFGHLSALAMSQSLAIMEEKLRISSLANEIRQLYHDIVQGSQIYIPMNAQDGGLLISYSLMQSTPTTVSPPLRQNHQYSSDSNNATRDTVGTLSYHTVENKTASFQLKTKRDVYPEQAILPLIDTKLIKQMSTTLPIILQSLLTEKIFQIADPRITLSELAGQLEENVEVIISIMIESYNHHIVDIINPILLSSVYYVNTDTDLRMQSNVNKAFYLHFADYFSVRTIELSTILNLFNGKNNLDQIINLLPNALSEYALDITIWLLRWHVIIELQQYVIYSPLFSHQNINNDTNNNNGYISHTTGLFDDVRHNNKSNHNNSDHNYHHFLGQQQQQQHASTVHDIIHDIFSEHNVTKISLKELAWRTHLTLDELLPFLEESEDVIITSM